MADAVLADLVRMRDGLTDAENDHRGGYHAGSFFGHFAAELADAIAANKATLAHVEPGCVTTTPISRDEADRLWPDDEPADPDAAAADQALTKVLALEAERRRNQPQPDEPPDTHEPPAWTA
jgi:hypothetical protein